MVFRLVKSIPKSAYIRAKIGQQGLKYDKILRSLCYKVHQLEKSTPPPVVVVVTNMSYAKDAKMWMIYSGIFVTNVHLLLSVAFVEDLLVRFHLRNCRAELLVEFFKHSGWFN